MVRRVGLGPTKFPNYQFGALPTWPPSYMGALSRKHQNGSLSLSTPKILALRLIELTCSVCIPLTAQTVGALFICLELQCTSLCILFDLCRPSPYQLFNLRSYSTSEETRSEHWVATPILPAPEVFQLPWHLHVVTHSMWDRRLMLLNLTQD